MKTKDELLAMIKSAADPDKQAETLADLSEEITALFDDYDGSKKEVSKLNGQVQDLRDSNMRLFLRITGETKEEEQEPDIAEQVDAQILEKFKN